MFLSASFHSFPNLSIPQKKKDPSISKSSGELSMISVISQSVSCGLKPEITKSFKTNSVFTQVSLLSSSSILSEESSQ
jgi:hypothetical protein